MKQNKKDLEKYLRVYIEKHNNYTGLEQHVDE